MKHTLTSEDSRCLDAVVGSLLISRRLRDALAAEGCAALRRYQDDVLTAITPGAWREIRRIAPHSLDELASGLEELRRRSAPLPKQMGAAEERFDAA